MTAGGIIGRIGGSAIGAFVGDYIGNSVVYSAFTKKDAQKIMTDMFFNWLLEFGRGGVNNIKLQGEVCVKKQDNKIIASDIDASLSYGQIFSGKIWNGVLMFLYILMGISAVIMVAWLIGVPLTMGKYDSSDMAFLIGGPCFVIIMVVILISLQMFFNKGKKKATLWLEDAIVLEAYAKSVGQTLHVRNMIARTATAIEVNFKYDDKRCVRQSTYKDKPLYLAVYTKYADKKILIAYSPKYDEVMLIKPESVKRLKDNSNM